MAEKKQKKIHWTKDPANKEKLREIRLKGAATLARNRAQEKKNAKQSGKNKATAKPKPTPSGELPSVPLIEEGIFSYALGWIESWLDSYAKAAGVPSETLATGLGKVLSSKSKR